MGRSTLTDIIGTAGNDTLTGTTANEAFYGLEGDDILMGGAGADVIDGGAGYDRVSYADYTTDLTIDLAAGTASDGDQFTNVEGAIGGSGDDTIIGDGGANIIDGGFGADIINGGDGFDTLTFTDLYGNPSTTRQTTVTITLTVDPVTGVSIGTTSDGDELTSIEGVIGGNADDTLIGNAYDNVLDGGKGADILNGGDGNDYVSYAYRTATEAVTANLATGANTDGDTFTSIENLIGGGGDDELTGNDLNNILDGGLGADTLDGGDGIDTVSYSERTTSVTANLATGANTDDDTFISIESLTGGQGHDILTGNAGANVLDGGAGDDALNGGLGDDFLNGRDGADTIDGGAGFDTVSFFGAGAGMRIDLTTGQAGEGNYAGFSTGTPIDQLQNVEAILGSDHNDVIFSIDGARIDGGRGNDILISSAGSDTLIGNDGTDGVAYLEAASGVTASLATGTGTAGEATGDVYTGIENLYASQFDDVITGDDGANTLVGYAGDDAISGGLGDDIIYGGAGIDQIDGGDGTDTFVATDSTAGMTIDLASGTTSDQDALTSIENITGTTFNDTIIGDAGDNRLSGSSGDDILIGGLGEDALIGGDGFDFASYQDRMTGVTVFLGATEGNEDRFASIEGLIGGSGDDIFNGTSINNIFIGGDGNDRLAGADGDDVLTGGNGDDLLRGGNGADTLDGGAGTDTISYVEQHVDLTIDLSTGTAPHDDTLISIENVIAGTENDTVTGDGGNNQLDGYSGDDLLAGGNGDDILLGNTGNDTLSGGDGDDVLIGGSGRDIMTGGNGADRFVFQSLTDSGAGTSSRDRIMDLDIAAGDRIDLSTFDIDPSTSAHETMTYIGSGAYTGTAGEVRIAASANAGYTSVGIDTDGDGTSNFLFEVALPVADFSADAFLL